VHEIGPSVAGSVREWFDQPENRELVRRLAEAGVQVEEAAGDEPALPQSLAGKQLVLTGGLERLTRQEAQAALEARGARVTSAVSKKTTYVVAGADPSAEKLAKAEALEVRVLSEAELERLLAGGELE
jgi:DNA ligase (NAD+)